MLVGLPLQNQIFSVHGENVHFHKQMWKNAIIGFRGKHKFWLDLDLNTHPLYTVHHIPWPSLFSVQEFRGDGGPDNSRYEDTCAELPARSRGLCRGQGQEERERGTQPNTEHGEGWAGEPNAFVTIPGSSSHICCHPCVSLSLCKLYLVRFDFITFTSCHCLVGGGVSTTLHMLYR